MDSQKTIQIFYKMLKSRLFEEKVVELQEQGLIKDDLYLSYGQEATIGAIEALSDDDIIFASRRNFNIAIGSDVDTKLIFNELMGNPDGICQGVAGGVISDNTVNYYGSSSLSSSVFAKAAGAAMSQKLQNNDNVVVCFSGDGQAASGEFYEALQISVMKKLPIVFFIENNCYAGKTPSDKANAMLDVAAIAKSFEIPGLIIDGNDAISVYENMVSARQFANESGPVIVESKTYRFAGHTYNEDSSYRSEAEIAQWYNYDAIENLKEYMLNNSIGVMEDLVNLRNYLKEDIDTSCAQACGYIEQEEVIKESEEALQSEEPELDAQLFLDIE